MFGLFHAAFVLSSVGPYNDQHEDEEQPESDTQVENGRPIDHLNDGPHPEGNT